ncbi:Mg2+ transporter protein CorA-like/Zinc transport protein ZntB [Penicillium hispanicum]|uniref:Mg2+ transporter protein CorA-like/Zinc transport protein ZntB n=1 Tax=Penicillium hispanicum TaxID=1080232 RepID=UPI00253FEF9D|nr:Mg2+ transporter protein CorA-like/Zinc transport protein ZntB [Penicillium hispanicum]KAJ5578156.1 Mg2+ transporter protein CorA-like/Zinc transport protein ZntB [Penicillium hispanicum]
MPPDADVKDFTEETEKIEASQSQPSNIKNLQSYVEDVDDDSLYPSKPYANSEGDSETKDRAYDLRPPWVKDESYQIWPTDSNSNSSDELQQSMEMRKGIMQSQPLSCLDSDHQSGCISHEPRPSSLSSVIQDLDRHEKDARITAEGSTASFSADEQGVKSRTQEHDINGSKQERGNLPTLPIDAYQAAKEESESGSIHIPTAINVFDYIVPGVDDEGSEKPGDNHEGANPFTYQDFNDAWTTASVVSEGSLKERDASETTGIAPIFTWRPETIDGLPTSSSQVLDGIPEQYRHMDRIIRVILEERDIEALRTLDKSPLERKFVDEILGCSRSDVLAQVEKIDSTLIHYDGLDSVANMIAVWSKKQKVIASALEILDAFVPVEYQTMDQYWLIKKFWGALMNFANDDFSDSYLDQVGEVVSYFCQSLRHIHAGVSSNRDKQSTTYYLPKALEGVFNMLIFYICACSGAGDTNGPKWHLLQLKAEKINEALLISRNQLIAMIHAGDYSEAKVFRKVHARDITTFIVERLASAPTGNPHFTTKNQKEFSLLQVYREHISRLEMQARSSPNPETFEQIQQLREELGIVNIVLDQQLRVLQQMRMIWDILKHSKNQTSMQSIHQSRKRIKQLKHDLQELEDLAEKTSRLVSCPTEVPRLDSLL